MLKAKGVVFAEEGILRSRKEGLITLAVGVILSLFPCSVNEGDRQSREGNSFGSVLEESNLWIIIYKA